MKQEQKLANLLHLCAETHHTVYKKVEGDDPEWPLWYAHWLLTLSDLSELLPKIKTQSELVYILVTLDKEYVEQSPKEEWPQYYAMRLLGTYA